VWAVRLTKTRSQGTSACRAGHITVNGDRAKPATLVRVGDTVEVRLHGRVRIVEVTRLLVKRVGASEAQAAYVDHSPPPPPRDKAMPFGIREPGTGRPTKRERRQLDRLRGRR
jgi:ribosome-associated heat shock protein Hsp15